MSHYFKGKLSSFYLQFFFFSYTPSLLEEIFFLLRWGWGTAEVRGWYLGVVKLEDRK